MPNAGQSSPKRAWRKKFRYNASKTARKIKKTQKGRGLTPAFSDLCPDVKFKINRDPANRIHVDFRK